MYKFKKGDTVKIVRFGNGCSPEEIGKTVKITGLGSYFGESGYTTEPKVGNGITQQHNSMIGESSFELVESAKEEITINIVLRCIYSSHSAIFTKGTEYKVKSESDSYYTIKGNDDNWRLVTLKDNLWGFEIITSTKELSKEEEVKEYIVTIESSQFVIDRWYRCSCNKNLYQFDGYLTSEKFGSKAIINPTDTPHGNVSKGYTERTDNNHCVEYFNPENYVKDLSEIAKYLPKIPQFIVGKWYKSSMWSDNSYCKFLEIKDGKFYHSENIRKGNQCVRKHDWWGFGIKTITECSLEEIQKYLPEGHVDKIVKVSSWIPQVGELCVVKTGVTKKSLGNNSNLQEGNIFKVSEFDYLKQIRGDDKDYWIFPEGNTTGGAIALSNLRKPLPHEIPTESVTLQDLAGIRSDKPLTEGLVKYLYNEGDYIVCNEEVGGWIRKGEIAILGGTCWNAESVNIHYFLKAKTVKNPYGNGCFRKTDFRHATKEEVEAYKNGIRNISDMKVNSYKTDYVSLPFLKECIKLKVIKDIPAKFHGFNNPFIPEGSITWCEVFGPPIILENNRYSTNFSIEYFEIIKEETIQNEGMSREQYQYVMGTIAPTLQYEFTKEISDKTLQLLQPKEDKRFDTSVNKIESVKIQLKQKSKSIKF